MVADDPARRSRRGVSCAEQLAHVLAAARRSARAPSSSGSVAEDALDLLVDRRGQEPSDSGARLLRGRTRGRRRRSPSTRASRRSPRRAGAGAARNALRRRRRARRARGPAVEPRPATNSCSDPERRVERAGRSTTTSRASAGACSKPCAAEEAQQLELRVDPGLEPPVDLEDQLVVEDERRVRLLDADAPRRAQLDAAGGEGRRATRNSIVPSSAATVAPRAHQVDELATRAPRRRAGRASSEPSRSLETAAGRLVRPGRRSASRRARSASAGAGGRAAAPCRRCARRSTSRDFAPNQRWPVT